MAVLSHGVFLESIQQKQTITKCIPPIMWNHVQISMIQLCSYNCYLILLLVMTEWRCYQSVIAIRTGLAYSCNLCLK